jgi:hypothetical protein
MRTWNCFPLIPKIFKTIPFYLVLTLRSRFSCFCMFFTFRDLPDIKRTQKKLYVNFWENRRPWEEEVNRGCNKAQKRANYVGHRPISGLMHPFYAILIPTDSPWHKTDYIKGSPRAISWQGGGETQNKQNWSKDCQDRRGDTTGAAPGCPFDSIDTISFSNMMKREYFTP